MVNPKDPLAKEEKCGVIYKCQCRECGEVYVGESERSLGVRAEEHDKSLVKRDSKSALSQHQERTGHTVVEEKVVEKMEIIDSEARNPHRKIKEAIHIKLLGATLNRNDGAELPGVYLPLLREEAGGLRGETD